MIQQEDILIGKLYVSGKPITIYNQYPHICNNDYNNVDINSSIYTCIKVVE